VEQYAKSKIPLFVENAVVGDLAKCTWHGKANRLSRENPVPWEIIDDVAIASWKSAVERRMLSLSPPAMDDASRETRNTGPNAGKNYQTAQKCCGL